MISIRHFLRITATLAMIMMLPSTFATEYLKPKIFYHHYPRDSSATALWWPKSAELKAEILAKCTNAETISCTFDFGDEIWTAGDSAWDKWKWQGRRVWTTQKPGYPATTLITEGIWGPLFEYCPADGGWSFSPSASGSYCSRDDSNDTDCDSCKGHTPAAALPPKLGNPIYPQNQIKEETRVDYQNVSGTLRFVRTYRSDQNRWTNNYEVSVRDLNLPVPTNEIPQGACFMERDKVGLARNCYPYMARGQTNDIMLRRGFDRARYFSSGNNFAAATGIRDRLTPIVDAGGNRVGWNVVNGETQAVESYSLNGQLIRSTELNGQITTFTYSDALTPTETAPRSGLLLQVADVFGASLQFRYNAQSQLVTMVDPAGGVYAYSYDAYGNLSSVGYPDNSQIRYLYNESAMVTPPMPTALTGIVDENGVRYATFRYSNGKAVSTEHAGGVQKYSFNSQSSSNVTVTDPLGQIYSYNYVDNAAGRRRFTGYSFGSVSNRIYYDTNGNVSSVTGFDGQITAYTYDLIRNLETKRVEASGTALARTISTEWHPTLDLPVRVAEPKRVTTYGYDAQGRMLTKSIRPTTDVSGASGFSAVSVGAAQTSSWSYNEFGRPLTATGSRTDVSAVTSYTYDSTGNLATITNALGHVTTLSDYDAHGNVGKVIDPNGIVTTYGYAIRGWLTTVVKGTQKTSYDYDAAGQMLQATFPDNSKLYYEYDAAHRLTAVRDDLGNKIQYTLDNMGNRTSEQTSDSANNLTRQISRVYNSLGQLKQITGGLQ